jgi:Glycopeptide antibiotics resistance protein
MMIYFDIYDFLIGVGLLCILLPVIWRRKHKLSYLFFFSLFWVYLLAVVQAVIFPFVINTTSSTASFTPSINLVPFYFGGCFNNMPAQCTAGIADNILLTIPFGFGINFLARVRPKGIFWLALAVGLGLELAQLCISLLFRSGFRASDINDAIFNAAGVLLGYTFFRVFAWLYLRAIDYFGFRPKWLAADIYDVAIQTHAADKSKQVIKS